MKAQKVKRMQILACGVSQDRIDRMSATCGNAVLSILHVPDHRTTHALRDGEGPAIRVLHVMVGTVVGVEVVSTQVTYPHPRRVMVTREDDLPVSLIAHGPLAAGVSTHQRRGGTSG